MRTRKFLVIVGAFWQRALTYRFTVVAYRVGETAEMLVLVLMWGAIYAGQEVIGGFTLREMITYILVGNLFHVMVRNFLQDVIARDIKDGNLSMFLVRPMGYFSYVLTMGIGRTSLATAMSIVSQGIVMTFFFRRVMWNFDVGYLALIAVMIFLAFVMELLISFLVGLLAFWTDEVDGLYATIDRVKKFFSGGYFPLSLLPLWMAEVGSALPFAYSFFVPAELYLKKIDITSGLKGLAVQLFWILFLLLVIKFVWGRGLRRYEGVGI